MEALEIEIRYPTYVQAIPFTLDKIELTGVLRYACSPEPYDFAVMMVAEFDNMDALEHTPNAMLTSKIIRTARQRYPSLEKLHVAKGFRSIGRGKYGVLFYG